MEWLFLLLALAAGGAADLLHAWPADARWIIGYAAFAIALLVLVLGS